MTVTNPHIKHVDPGKYLDYAEYYSDTGHTVDYALVRTATYVIAASDSSNSEKAQADVTCDGTQDDVEIQAGIDSLSATGGTVFLQTGTFTISAIIDMDSANVHLTGVSRYGTKIIKAAAAAKTRAINMSGSGTSLANMTIQGDGSTASERLVDFSADGTWADNVRFTTSTQYNAVIDDAENVRLVRCESDGCTNSTANSGAIFCYLSSAVIDGLYSHGNTNHALYVYNYETDTVDIVNSLSDADKGMLKVVPGRGNYALLAHGPIGIRNCTVKNSTDLPFDGSGLATSLNQSPVTINCCVIMDSVSNAIDAGGGSGWVINGNIIWGVNTADTADEGYGVTNCNRAQITNNWIGACWRAGIALYNDSDCQVSNNTIENCNMTQYFSDEDPADSAIYIWASGSGKESKRNIVSNNIIKDVGATSARTLGAAASTGDSSVSYAGSLDFFPWQTVAINEGATTEYQLVDYCSFSTPNTTVYFTSTLANDFTTSATITGVATMVYGVSEKEASSGACDDNLISGNSCHGNTSTDVVLASGSHSVVKDNVGFIGAGEIRTYNGSIATLTENAYNSIDNPFGQDVLVLDETIYISTKATSGAPRLDCGIGSSATTDYTTVFDDITCETVGAYHSVNTTTIGKQTSPILWQTGTGNRYFNHSIKAAAATGMVAQYSIRVMGV